MSVLQPTMGFDIVHPDARFPVVESVQLDPVPNRMLRRTQRRIDDLPVLAGGSVFVFQTNDRFALAPTGPKMLGSEVVVKATMVSVVLTRAQEVPAVVTLSTVSSAIRLTLRAIYNCRVHDPVRVLQSGCWDVRSNLRGYLLKDAKLRMLSAREDAGRNPEVIQRLLAVMYARHALEPPVIPGMDVQLLDMALNLQSDHARMPGQRQPSDETDYGRNDGYPDTGDGGPPRDRY